MDEEPPAPGDLPGAGGEGRPLGADRFRRASRPPARPPPPRASPPRRRRPESPGPPAPSAPRTRLPPGGPALLAARPATTARPPANVVEAAPGPAISAGGAEPSDPHVRGAGVAGERADAGGGHDPSRHGLHGGAPAHSGCERSRQVVKAGNAHRRLPHSQPRPQRRARARPSSAGPVRSPRASPPPLPTAKIDEAGHRASTGCDAASGEIDVISNGTTPPVRSDPSPHRVRGRSCLIWGC